MTDDAAPMAMRAESASAPAADAKVVDAVKTGLLGTELKRLAQSGGFAVDDSTGNQLIEALEGVLESLEKRWAALQRLRDAPAMSRTATGQWVSAHMANTAADDHGLLTQLESARREFPTYIEAIKQAKKNYRSREEETRVRLVSLPSADQS
ncbi:hypothetical protein [Amycolatopsis australiensis]|uniref:PE family protein n=1 Tax=Amycolatopsis australiensis TaxID=546364 RepID=A0A1K1S8Z7_9PSEU|nr:hypothetical protein [Amycolatopsis australiensis]SFW80548.1 hypothetical protein SAMN04489730_5006 [Amycolatopsis australiensis]